MPIWTTAGFAGGGCALSSGACARARSGSRRTRHAKQAARRDIMIEIMPPGPKCKWRILHTLAFVLAELLLKWPLIRQLKTGADGTGVESMSEATHALRPKNEGTEVTRSICPYCGVGCGQLVYHRQGKVVSIEGDPESPISRGHLCPKGAASYQLVTHDGRTTTVKYRAPRSREWTEIPLDLAMG